MEKSQIKAKMALCFLNSYNLLISQPCSKVSSLSMFLKIWNTKFSRWQNYITNIPFFVHHRHLHAPQYIHTKLYQQSSQRHGTGVGRIIKWIMHHHHHHHHHRSWQVLGLTYHTVSTVIVYFVVYQAWAISGKYFCLTCFWSSNLSPYHLYNIQ